MRRAGVSFVVTSIQLEAARVLQFHPKLIATMPPTKRARTATASSSASSSSRNPGAAPKLTLSGGVPHHPSLAGLWRDERLTDFAICAEGVEFKAHRVALASSSKYFLNLRERSTPLTSAEFSPRPSRKYWVVPGRA